MAREVYRDSFESRRLGFGLVNQPEYGPWLYSFSLLLLLLTWFDLALVDFMLAEYLWVETTFGLDNG